MKAIKLLGVSVVAVALNASAAFAKVDSTTGAVAPLPKAVTLADNVVVTPSSQAAPAPAPAPTPAQTQVQVQPAQPVQAVEPVACQRRRTGRSSPKTGRATTWRPSRSAR